MQRSEIVVALRSLAEGIDPATGETAGERCVIHNPHAIRALYGAIGELEQSVSVPGRRGAPPLNAGKPWGVEEDAVLAQGFDAGKKIAELCRDHSRSRNSIKARLIKLGKLQP